MSDRRVTDLIAKARALAQHSRDECLCTTYDDETIDALANDLETHANALNRVRMVQQEFRSLTKAGIAEAEDLLLAISDALNGPQDQMPYPEPPGYQLSPEIARLRTDDGVGVCREYRDAFAFCVRPQGHDGYHRWSEEAP